MEHSIHARLLIIEDDAALGDALLLYLSRKGFRCEVQNALSVTHWHPLPDLLVIDADLHNQDVGALLQAIWANVLICHIPIILLMDPPAVGKHSHVRAVVRMISKPFHVKRLVELILQLLAESGQLLSAKQNAL